MIVAAVLVLNGEKFLGQCVINAFKCGADRVIICEGATEEIDLPDEYHKNGRSIDATGEIIKDLITNDSRVSLIEHQGRWESKIVMLNTILRECETGDVYWIKDMDEFYEPDRMQGVLKEFEEGQYTSADFYWWHFVGSPYWSHVCNGWGNKIQKRLFRVKKPIEFVEFRPLIIEGSQDKLMDRDQTLMGHGCRIYHYGYIYQEQFDFKVQYYQGRKEHLNMETYKNIYQNAPKDGTTVATPCGWFCYRGEPNPEWIKQ